jgi:glucosyl-dolichyl phosphate glucuronosyltransferase
MKAEIVICTYNRASKLNEAMQSILNAEVPENVSVQLTIVDNNSTDKTDTLIRQFTKNGSKISIQCLFEENQGKSHALNTALRHITGDLIAFTDDDVTVDKCWIREMVKALQKYPEHKCFGGKVVVIYPENMPNWLDIHESMKFVKSIFVDRDDGDMEIEYGVNTISKTPSGCNMFFRRKVVDKNGPFRQDLGPVGNNLGFSEDTDYCQRLLEKGERFMYIPSAIIYHPVHTERLTKRYLLNWQYKCGRSEVRRNGGYKETPKVFGMPRYLFRKFIQHAVGLGLSLETKERFYHRLRLYYAFGEIVEHVRIGFKK